MSKNGLHIFFKGMGSGAVEKLQARRGRQEPGIPKNKQPNRTTKGRLI